MKTSLAIIYGKNILYINCLPLCGLQKVYPLSNHIFIPPAEIKRMTEKKQKPTEITNR